MRIRPTDPPRVFSVSGGEIRDCGKVELEPGEMVSLRTASGKECDIVATEWGYYLGPSLNARLKEQGFRSALVVNKLGKIYVYAIEKEKMAELEKYLAEQGTRVVMWLDEWRAPAIS